MKRNVKDFQNLFKKPVVKNNNKKNSFFFNARFITYLVKFIIHGDTDGLPFAFLSFALISMANLSALQLICTKGHLSGATGDPVLPSFSVEPHEFFIRTVLCETESRDAARLRCP